MTKEYVSTQRYQAFYWDGSNVEALQEWLGEIGVEKECTIEKPIEWPASGDQRWELIYLGDWLGTLTPTKEMWIVKGVDRIHYDDCSGCNLQVVEPETFNKFFVEVAG